MQLLAFFSVKLIAKFERAHCYYIKQESMYDAKLILNMEKQENISGHLPSFYKKSEFN